LDESGSELDSIQIKTNFPVLAVVGSSGSGKTTLIEYLVRNLSKEGIKIGTVKHVHHQGFTIDTKNKDTWKHAKAGAQVVVCVSPEEIAKIKRKKSSENDLHCALESLKNENLDFLIIEGFRTLTSKFMSIPKIITAKNEESLEETLEQITGRILAITGIIANQCNNSKERPIPRINLNIEGHRIIELVKSYMRTEDTSAGFIDELNVLVES
jgi:molybdopterin-guanine dinucleotide biosynthesis protein MobB